MDRDSEGPRTGEGAPNQPGTSNNHTNLDPLSDLNAEEMAKLIQLQNLINNEDLGLCRALLESKDWDVEATMKEQLEDNSQSQNSRQSEPEAELEPLPRAPTMARVSRAPIRFRRQGWVAWAMNWGYFIITTPVLLPFRLTYSLLHGTFSLISRFFGLESLTGPGDRAVVQGSNALGDVRWFNEMFEESYGPNHPQFYLGSYSQVLDEAKKDLKFVLTYLHSPDHEDTDVFCRDVIASSEFSDFLRDNNILLWGCSVRRAEGYRVSQALRENSYPFLAVIVLRQNKMTMVGRMEGYMDKGELLVRLHSIIRDNEAFIVATRAEREERRRNHNIRLEQDAAFQETLRQDQERERKKQQDLERKRKEEEEELRLEQEERQRKEKIRQMKMDLVSQVAEEPQSNHPDMIRMLIKLPGGQRLERKFLKSQSLKDLYLFVFCHPDSPDEFNIEMNFPKKVLKCKPEDNPASFEEAGLGQSTTLFVHDLEA